MLMTVDCITTDSWQHAVTWHVQHQVAENETKAWEPMQTPMSQYTGAGCLKFWFERRQIEQDQPGHGCKTLGTLCVNSKSVHSFLLSRTMMVPVQPAFCVVTHWL